MKCGLTLMTSKRSPACSGLQRSTAKILAQLTCTIWICSSSVSSPAAVSSADECFSKNAERCSHVSMLQLARLLQYLASLSTWLVFDPPLSKKYPRIWGHVGMQTKPCLEMMYAKCQRIDGYTHDESSVNLTVKGLESEPAIYFGNIAHLNSSDQLHRIQNSWVGPAILTRFAPTDKSRLPFFSVHMQGAGKLKAMPQTPMSCWPCKIQFFFCLFIDLVHDAGCRSNLLACCSRAICVMCVVAFFPNLSLHQVWASTYCFHLQPMPNKQHTLLLRQDIPTSKLWGLNDRSVYLLATHYNLATWNLIQGWMNL